MWLASSHTMNVLSWILLLGAAASMVVYALGLWSTRRHYLQEPPTVGDEHLLPISLLKPIKGTEESLAANLRTFFVQDYPAPFEIIFATAEPDDAGIDVAREVAAEFPDVKVRFVLSDPTYGLNPKVANLAGALAAARHDLVLQSDANVRVRPDYLRRIVGELLAREASLLTSIVVGVEERSLGAAMENLQLSAFVGPAMCTALHVAGVNCVVGKSMLLRRSELDEVGGLEYVRDILCEDFILGQRYQEAGKKVVLSCTAVENVNQDIDVTQFLARHSRWFKMTAVIHRGGFVAQLFANPVALLLAALVASGFDAGVALALAAAVGVKLVGDAFLMWRTRGRPMRLVHLVVSPFKDAMMAIVWFHACFSRSVDWRGVRLRFGAESRLRPDDGALPIRVARRLLGVHH